MRSHLFTQQGAIGRTFWVEDQWVGFITEETLEFLAALGRTEFQQLVLRKHQRSLLGLRGIYPE